VFDVIFVCGVLAILPVFLLFMWLKEPLTKGIEFVSIK